MYVSKNILFIAIAGIVVMILITCNRCNPPGIQAAQQKIDTLVWVNDAGDIVASLKGTPESFAVVDTRYKDSVAKVYGVKEKNLQQYITALETTNADLTAVANTKQADYFPMDSTKSCPPQVKSLRQAFTNPYYRALVQVGDSSFLKIQSFDTLSVVWKRIKAGNLFNRQTLLQLDVSTANKDTKIYGVKAYRVAEKRRKVSIGFQLGYGFSNSLAPSPYLGVGIQYNIFNF